MHIYIANPTKKHHTFFYRLPEVANVRKQDIRYGEQTKIAGDLSKLQYDSIVAQLERYNIPRIQEVHGIKRHNGLMWDDKPISAIAIEHALNLSRSTLIDRGKENRQRAAIAQNKVLENAIEESGLPISVKALEMSVVETESTASTSDDPVAEGIRVEGPYQDAKPEEIRTSNRRGKRGRSSNSDD